MSEEAIIETITLEQFAQALANQEVHGTPVGTAYPVPKREPVPGQEIHRQRVRVSFEFECYVNTSPILSSGNDDDVKGHDLALLYKFLVADKAKLLEMLVDQCAIELGLNSCESFIQMFLGQINFGSGELERRLFGTAIEQLEGESGQYWRDIRDEPRDRVHGDILSICTEKLFECFKAEFTSSSYEIVEDTKGENK